MRRTFLLLVCALALFSVKQTCGQIVRGRVVDQERQPVVGVAVVMLDTDSTYLAAAASDADGRFAIASEVRPYRLLFQHLAYEMQTLTSEHDEAGEVVLHEYTNALDAVVVEGEKPIVRVEEGRLAYDLEAVSKGKAVNNAYEALTQLPGVSEQDGGLTLAGAGGVTVILNGKPSTMSAEQLASLLRSTPVERIEKAEVMYSTPPQYHVSGAAINLVLRRSHDYSFSGEVHANYTNRFYSNWDAGGNFAFSSPEWSAEVTYSAGQAKTKRIIDLYSRHTLADGEHEIAQRQNITSKGTWHRLRAAAEYAPQGKGRLSIAYTGAYTPHTSGLVRADGNLVNSVSSPGGDNAIVPLRPGKWLDSRLTLTGMRMTQRCDAFHDLAFDRSKWLGVVRMDNTIRLSRKPDLTLDLSGYYQSAAIQGTYDVAPSWSVNAGVKWTFDKSRASLSVRCNDIFESSLPFAKVRYKGQYLDMDSGTYTRSVTVHFSYRFGTYKEKRHKTVDTSRFGH